MLDNNKKTCLNCKKVFERPVVICHQSYGTYSYPQHISIWSKRQFCNRKCGALFIQSPRKRKLEGKYIRNCLVCEKQFALPILKNGKYESNTNWNKSYKTCGLVCARKLSGISKIGGKRTKETKEKMRVSSILAMSKRRSFKDTDIELLIEGVLKNKSIKYSKQYVVKGISIVDFYLPDFNTVIECDGDFWHKREGRQEKDKIKTNKMIDTGYNVFRFWGSEIIKSPEWCVNKVLQHIKAKNI
jgi:very-short-patch-repair endonuclease